MSGMKDIAGDGIVAALGDTLGETITYTPSGGTAFQVTAVVDRGGLMRGRADGGSTLRWTREVLIPISKLVAVNRGADEVTMPVWPGGPDKTYRVSEIASCDGGYWRLGLGG